MVRVRQYYTGDSEKVLVPPEAGLQQFMHSYRFPDTRIYATGSSEAQTRLYRMGINKYFDIVQADFHIMGEHQSVWEWYEKGKDYQAFAVQRKNQ